MAQKRVLLPMLILCGSLLSVLWLLDQLLPATPSPILFGTWMIDDRHQYPIPDLGTCITLQPDRTFHSYSADVLSTGSYRVGLISRQRLKLSFTWGAAVAYHITIIDSDHLLAQDDHRQYSYHRFTGDPITCFTGQ